MPTLSDKRMRVGVEPFQVELTHLCKIYQGVKSIIQESIQVRLHKGLFDMVKEMIKVRLLKKNVKG